MFHFQLRNLDPFLMLDEFKVKKPAGFPDHPHRGFETVRVSAFPDCSADCGCKYSDELEKPFESSLFMS